MTTQGTAIRFVGINKFFGTPSSPNKQAQAPPPPHNACPKPGALTIADCLDLNYQFENPASSGSGTRASSCSRCVRRTTSSASSS